ncbi:MAG: cation:proton antiporter [Simkaniaceae bacterium]|nr:MAG: cation:proton antiporter [Simkaniaceae bacterium]
MTTNDIALYSFFFLILSWGSKRLPFIPLLCLLLGIVWGFLGARPHISTLQFTTKIALIFFLFVDGAKLHIPKILRYQSIRLPTIGLLVTLLLGMGLIKALFPLSMMEAFVVMLPLLAIDGRVVDPAFSSHIPSRISQMLNVEGAFTGIFAFFVLSLVHLPHPLHFFIGIFFPLIAGSILGYICGLVGKTALECGWAQNNLFRGAFFLIPFAIFAFCDLFNANGFIGVIAAGITFGHTARFLCDSLFDLSRRQAPYLFYLLLIFFGIFSLHILSSAMTFTLIFFAVVFLIVIRFLAVLISLQKSHFQWKTLGYFTFFSPKGLISIAIALLFTEYLSFPNASLMLAIILTTTLFSLLIHPLFAYPVAMSYADGIHSYPRAPEHFPTVSLPH